MSIAERLGLGKSKQRSDKSDIVEELDEVETIFSRGRFTKRHLRSLEDLAENVLEVKQSHLECMSRATGMNPEGKLTMYAFSLEYVSEKLAEDIITRCKYCQNKDSRNNLNFGSSKSKQLREHLSRVNDISKFSGQKLSNLREKCNTTECYESLNESWEIYNKLKEINEELKVFHKDIVEKSGKEKQPDWTYAD